MTVKIYGIKNCNSMKKAFDWLDENGVAYDFHDYKKQGADVEILRQAMGEHGWETVINRKGMTWRNLPDIAKEHMDEENAIKAACDNPSLIKRPLIVANKQTFLGYDEDTFAQNFKN